MEGLSIAIALKTPKTVEEPHISYFISSMEAAGFIEIPPASNVNPFPTRILGFSFPPFMYSNIINFGGSSEPCATPANAPIPIFVKSSRSRTFNFISPSIAISSANAAK